MANSIDELKSTISSKGGLARSNQFMIQIPTVNGISFPNIRGFNLPSILGLNAGGTSSRELDILCKTAEIPGRQLLVRERAIGMQPEQIAYGYSVPDISLTFHLLNDYGVRKFFEDWQKTILNDDTGEVGYKTDYAKDVKIHQLKRPILNKQLSVGPIDLNFGIGGSFVYSVVLENAFPSTIQSVSFTNDADAIAEITVQLSYHKIRVVEQGAFAGAVQFGIGI
jgi:hypothetical protein